MNQSHKEEIANAWSHGAGIIFGVFSLPILLYSAFIQKGWYHSLPFFIYSGSFIFLFLSSTLYHAFKKEDLKKIFQKIDHISIYFMIAGSYTPFIFACLNGSVKWMFLALMWSIVLIGTIFKWFFTGKFENLSLFLYLAMGWMAIFILKPMFTHLEVLTIALIIAGGLSYTGGVYFYAKDHKRYHHFIWHLFVLAGSILHFIAIFGVAV